MCQNIFIATMGSKKTSTDKVHAANSVLADFAALSKAPSVNLEMKEMGIGCWGGQFQIWSSPSREMHMLLLELPLMQSLNWFLFSSLSRMRFGKKASKLKKKRLKGFYGGKFSVVNMREEMDG